MTREKQIAQAKEKDRCSCSPDTVLGIYIGIACMRHDSLYKKNWIEKIASDFMLMFGVMVEALRYTFTRKFLSVIPVMVYAVGMFISVSTVGWYFWFKTQEKVNK